jgi:IS605 OrfB family transposase
MRNRERNQSRDFNHKLANEILRTTANVIVVEELDVKQLKKRRHKGKTRSRKNQVSLGELRRMLTYKAALAGKQVVSVNPKYTSQRDCLTGKLIGERKGCRFYAKSGLVYDADINAAVNIAKRTKLPVLQGNLLDGQGLVIGPIVGQQCTHKLPNLFGSI